jgi:hypothetical protein
MLIAAILLAVPGYSVYLLVKYIVSPIAVHMLGPKFTRIMLLCLVASSQLVPM